MGGIRHPTRYSRYSQYLGSRHRAVSRNGVDQAAASVARMTFAPSSCLNATASGNVVTYVSTDAPDRSGSSARAGRSPRRSRWGARSAGQVQRDDDLSRVTGPTRAPGSPTTATRAPSPCAARAARRAWVSERPGVDGLGACVQPPRAARQDRSDRELPRRGPSRRARADRDSRRRCSLRPGSRHPAIVGTPQGRHAETTCVLSSGPLRFRPRKQSVTSARVAVRWRGRFPKTMTS